MFLLAHRLTRVLSATIATILTNLPAPVPAGTRVVRLMSALRILTDASLTARLTWRASCVAIAILSAEIHRRSATAKVLREFCHCALDERLGVSVFRPKKESMQHKRQHKETRKGGEEG